MAATVLGQSSLVLDHLTSPWQGMLSAVFHVAVKLRGRQFHHNHISYRYANQPFDDNGSEEMAATVLGHSSLVLAHLTSSWQGKLSAVFHVAVKLRGRQFHHNHISYRYANQPFDDNGSEEMAATVLGHSSLFLDHLTSPWQGMVPAVFHVAVKLRGRQFHHNHISYRHANQPFDDNGSEEMATTVLGHSSLVLDHLTSPWQGMLSAVFHVAVKLRGRQFHHNHISYRHANQPFDDNGTESMATTVLGQSSLEL